MPRPDSNWRRSHYQAAGFGSVVRIDRTSQHARGWIRFCAFLKRGDGQRESFTDHLRGWTIERRPVHTRRTRVQSLFHDGLDAANAGEFESVFLVSVHEPNRGVYAGSDGSRYAASLHYGSVLPPRASASLCARDAETSARDISSDTVLETATTRIRAPVPVSAPWLCPERDSELRCICATGRCGSNSTGTKPRWSSPNRAGERINLCYGTMENINSQFFFKL